VGLRLKINQMPETVELLPFDASTDRVRSAAEECTSRVREGKTTEKAAAEEGHPPFSFTSSPPTRIDHNDGTAREKAVDDRDRLFCFNCAVSILDGKCTEARRGRAYVCAEARAGELRRPARERKSSLTIARSTFHKPHSFLSTCQLI
jgi:hypothetical protein